jgi:hypothetical protein
MTNNTAPDSSGPAARVAGTARGSGRWLLALRILVSLGLLALVLSKIDLADALAVLRGARVDLPIAMLSVLALDRVVAAWRWYILLLAGTGITFGRVLRLVLVSGFAGYAVPGSVGVEMILSMGRSESRRISAALPGAWFYRRRGLRI